MSSRIQRGCVGFSFSELHCRCTATISALSATSTSKPSLSSLSSSSSSSKQRIMRNVLRQSSSVLQNQLKTVMQCCKICSRCEAVLHSSTFSTSCGYCSKNKLCMLHVLVRCQSSCVMLFDGWINFQLASCL